jgi:hypothetical protein
LIHAQEIERESERTIASAPTAIARDHTMKVSGRAPTSIQAQVTRHNIVANIAPEKTSALEEKEKPIAEVIITAIPTTAPLMNMNME